jgi:hypothetical protein
MPKGMMLVIGTVSITEAAGSVPAVTMFTGSTVRADGATPKTQEHMAPVTTRGGMAITYPVLPAA